MPFAGSENEEIRAKSVSPLLDLEAQNSEENEASPDLPCSPGFLRSPTSGITVELLGQDLWKKFYKLGTEMIITKAGR